MRNLFALSSVAALVAATTLSSQARADDDFSLHLEPGVVVPITSPQLDIYQPGVALGVKGMFALTPNLALGPTVSTLYVPRATDNGQNAGVLWQMGGSLRLQGDRRVADLSPWIDFDANLAATGDLLRPSLGVGVGMEAAMDAEHEAWFGPFLRYEHVFQTADTESGSLLDPRDVNFVEAGVSFAFDFPPRVKTVVQTKVVLQHVATPCPTCAPLGVAAPPPPPEKLDLSAKVYFDHDSATLRWESRDKLDAIVKALNEHPKLAIEVDGHASSDGQLAYNVQLSARRTAAVMQYLGAHGVDATRLAAKSLGVSQPAAPNTSKEGRERNRRVEFVVSFSGDSSK